MVVNVLFIFWIITLYVLVINILKEHTTSIFRAPSWLFSNKVEKLHSMLMIQVTTFYFYCYLFTLYNISECYNHFLSDSA